MEFGSEVISHVMDISTVDMRELKDVEFEKA